MEQKKLILKGDTSAAKAFSRFLPILIFFCIAGLAFFIFGIWMASNISHGRNYERDVFGSMLMIMLGLIFLVGGIALPFASVSQAKKCHITVYEDCVCGTYIERYQGYIPYNLAYDKIESASANKTKVCLQQTNGRTIYSQAFNAQEIAAAIQRRLRS